MSTSTKNRYNVRIFATDTSYSRVVGHRQQLRTWSQARRVVRFLRARGFDAVTSKVLVKLFVKCDSCAAWSPKGSAECVVCGDKV